MNVIHHAVETQSLASYEGFAFPQHEWLMVGRCVATAPALRGNADTSALTPKCALDIGCVMRICIVSTVCVTWLTWQHPYTRKTEFIQTAIFGIFSFFRASYWSSFYEQLPVLAGERRLAAALVAKQPRTFQPSPIYPSGHLLS